MSQQHPYGQFSPYPPGQYAPQPTLYPPSQAGSRPASPYQQLEPVGVSRPYTGPGYAQPPPPPPQTPSPYHQQLQPQGYQPDQPGYLPPQYPPPQDYPPLSQAYLPQGYPPVPPLTQGYQYAPPAPQPLLPQQQQGKPYTLLFQPSSQKHTRSLTPVGSTTPTYIATYNRALIYSSAPDIIISTASGSQLATVNWHNWSSKIDLNFSATGAQITYKDTFEPTGPGAANLGRLFWTITQGNEKQADLKCSDRTGATVCTVVLHDKLRSGKIEIWRQGLEKDLVEQVVVSAIAEIEDWKRKMESRNSNPGIIAGGVVAGLGN